MNILFYKRFVDAMRSCFFLNCANSFVVCEGKECLFVYERNVQWDKHQLAGCDSDG